MLETFEAICADGVKSRLLLAGPIVDKGAHALLLQARAKFGDALVEHGSVSGASKEIFFRSVDVFLFPSRYKDEAQPLVIFKR